LPQIRPFIAAAALWTIVSTAADMTVTNIYLVDPRQQTYTERFYMSLALSGQISLAAKEVIPAVASLAALIAVTAWLVARLGSRGRALRALRRPRTLGKLNPAATTSLWVIVLVLLAVPLASLMAKAGFVALHDDGQRIASWSLLACLREVAFAPSRFGREIWGTVYVAIGAASIALAMGCTLAWHARRGSWPSFFAITAIALGLSIPGPLIGASLIQLFNHDIAPRLALAGGLPKSWLLFLYDDTALAPILAQAIRALPLATLLLWHSFATINPHVLEAAALDALTPSQVFWRIALRQRRRALAAAWLASFAIAAGDLAWAHLVTPPGLDLLQRRIFGLIHSGVEEQVAAISLLIVGTYTVLAAVILLLLKPRAST
jgi:ABC-type Fe3+ transport system permease subunit